MDTDNTNKLKSQNQETTKQVQTETTQVRRNKRRNPPNYYQSAEYAAILKDSDVVKKIEQIKELSIADLNLDDKTCSNSTGPEILTNDATLKKEDEEPKQLPKMAWGKPVAVPCTTPHQQPQVRVQTSISELQSTPNIPIQTTKPTETPIIDNPTISSSTSKIDSQKPPTEIIIDKPPAVKSMATNWSKTLFKNPPTASNSPSSSSSVKNPRSNNSNNPITSNHIPSASNGIHSNESLSAPDGDVLKMLGNMLKQCELKHSAPALQPRGIVNKQTWCYINATLQALLACPPLYNLIKSIFQKIKSSNQNMKSVPCISALGRYISEFKTMIRAQQIDAKSTNNLTIGEPFAIDYFYEALANLKAEARFKSGRQEDAQEFLSFLLNRIHDEMVTCLDSLNPNVPAPKPEVVNVPVVIQEEADESDDWEVVGKKNRSHVTRKAEFKQSPLSDIFCGQIRSALSQPGVKEKDSWSLEPFFTLPLDIQADSVRNVQQALEYFVQKEEVFGFTNQDTKRETEAFKRMSFEDLPPVLIIYLKCFIYNPQGGIQKLLKRIEFQIDLEINKDLITPNQRSKLREKKRSYKLFAVEYHHGDKATGGHYITDVYHPGIVGWVRYDDSSVKVVNNAQVLKSEDRKLTPYLLYYRRTDYI